MKKLLLKGLLFLMPVVMLAQEKISGTVKDTEGEPMLGVSIIIKNTNKGTTTDFDGNFEIVANASDILVFNYIGYAQKEVLIGKKKHLDVVLSEDTQELKEVVVTGYQKTDRKLFAGAATKVSAEDTKIDGIVDVGKMIEGRVSGVSVQNVSGSFGAAPKIRIRGASSIYGDTKPLWVVDGVVLEDVVDVNPDQLSSGDISTLISSSVAGLNAEDIDSFQILKDASATALYGARAMNGVIVITTKNGSRDRVSIDVKSEYTMRSKPSYNDYDILNSQDQMSVFREMERKGWLSHADMMSSRDGGVYFQMYNAINTYQNGSYGLLNTPQARAEYLKTYEKINTDWFKLLFQNNLQQNHSVSFKGGSQKSQFYASTSFLHDTGWTISDKVNRYTINAKGTFDISDKFTLGISTKGSYREQRAPGTFSRQPSQVNGGYTREFDINPFSYALNTSRTISPYETDAKTYRYHRMNYAPFNILNEYNNNYIDLDVLDLNIQANLDYKINPNWSYSFVGNIRYVKNTTEHKIKADANVAKAYRANDDATIEDQNNYLWKDPENPSSRPIVVLPKGGFYNREDNLLKNFYLRNIIEYKNIALEDHRFNAILGQEVRASDRKGASFDGYGIQYDKGNTVFTDPNIIKKLTQAGFPYFAVSNSYDRFVAFFANGAYSFNSKYIFNATARLDGSNRLGSSADARWLPTWNVSGRWNAKDESFLQNVDWLSNLNIRATYGLTASMGPATNSRAVLRSTLTIAPYPDEIQNGLLVRSLQNSELTWEKQYEANAGFDIGVLNNRFSISADFYHRKGFDLIAAIRTSGIGGELIKLANYADMVSKGVEFSLNSRNIDTPSFKWTTDVTFAYNENEITRLYSEPNVFSLTRSEGAAKLGGPVRGLYSIPFAGLSNEGIPTFYDKEGKASYDIFFQDRNVNHLKYEGSIDPKITGGVSNRFTFDNFSLNLFFTYQLGNVVRLYPSFQARYSDLNAMPSDLKDRWLHSGDEAHTNVPTILSKPLYDKYGNNILSTYNAYNFSTERVAKGDFVRLKEVSLTYKVPNDFAKKLGVAGASFKVSGTNLFLLYSDKALKGQDPEFFGSGGVALPIARQYSWSLNINL
ncbi:SusC/RagA family TonB-linked outer membrane protein [Capnocytophaga canimorsus]|uniref:SusC/RagA family TonB-linked outer membrane protein n=1 Tax=Capnocytophaga canimorsus TaxID=28188 RepID=UPI0037D8E91E